MKKIISLIPLTFIIYALYMIFCGSAEAQVTGTIQKTPATGIVRGNFGVNGIDTLANVYSLPTFTNGQSLQWNTSIKKFQAYTPNPTITASALTKTDDTNVTLTLGGTPSTALLQATSITAGWAGTLSGARGGTGVDNTGKTITLGGNLTTSGANAVTLTTTGSTNVTLPTSGTLLTTAGSGASLSNVVNSITGTANQVVASASTGAVTLSLPQSIGTSGTPQFAKLSLGAATAGNVNFVNASNITGGADAYGQQLNATIQSGVTSNAFGNASILTTAASAFTVANLTHYYAAQNALGAGSAVTTQSGFLADGSMTGATNNYGFYGGLAAGTGRYNLYMGGDAPNYTAGSMTSVGGMVAARTSALSETVKMYAQAAAKWGATTFPGVIESVGNNILQIGSSAAAAVELVTNGTVGVSVNGSTQIITLSSLGTGAVQATAGVLSVVSDSKVKDLHGKFKTSALTAINSLAVPQYWNYNKKSKLGENAYKVNQFGLLADQVHAKLGEEFAPTQGTYKDGKFIPTLIDGKETYGLSDRALLSLAIQALQEANKKIEANAEVTKRQDARILYLEKQLIKP